MKKIQNFSSLLICLTLVACGGGGGGINPNPSANSSSTEHFAPSVATSLNEINSTNALLIASVANLATMRTIQLRELTQTVSDQALSSAPSISPSVNCRPSGNLSVNSLAFNSYDVTLNKCISRLGIRLEAGSMNVQNLVRSNTGNAVSFTATLNQVQLFDGLGTDNLSGLIDYRFSFENVSDPVYTTTHTGQLDYVRAGRADQYRNLDTTLTETRGKSTAYSLNVAHLEINSPRLPVAKISVSTPTPLLLTPTQASGSLLAVSSKDGSRVQIDMISYAQFKLRCWDSHGALTLDVVKGFQDKDVLNAEAQALN